MYGQAARVAVVLALNLPGATALGATPTQVKTFTSTGAEQRFVVPPGIAKLHVVAIGGRGADAIFGTGALGAQVTADLAVLPGQTLFVEVGGNGEGMSPGFNGGGSGANPGPGGGGGGASDVRRLAAASPDSLAGRLIVAAGGGGATVNAPGGAAGMPAGGFPWSGGAGQSDAGGAGGQGLQVRAQPGSLGVGGAGAIGAFGYGGGGGGGGLYGGGGGAGADRVCSSENACAYSNPGGGGGGSSGFGPGATNGVVAADAGGTPSVTLSYELPSNDFALGAPKAASTGTIAMRLTLPAAGRVKAVGRIVPSGLTYGTKVARRKAKGPVTVRLKPRAAARGLLARRGRLRVAVAVTFTPDGGTAKKRTRTLTVTSG